MAIVLIIVGLLIWLLVSPLIGIILVVLGLILFFVPAVPYGYGAWRGRNAPPP